jgi:RHS repeat-associated protein
VFRRFLHVLSLCIAACALLLSASARAGQRPLGKSVQPAAPALSVFSFEENRIKGEKAEHAKYTYRAPRVAPRLHVGKVPALSTDAVGPREREDYGFTGKESDVEVGLTYFGKRYLVPGTGRWLSPDPLAVHVPGKADLNLYAYVHGRVFTSVDPWGLDPPRVPTPTNLEDAVAHDSQRAGTWIATTTWGTQPMDGAAGFALGAMLMNYFVHNQTPDAFDVAATANAAAADRRVGYENSQLGMSKLEAVRTKVVKEPSITSRDTRGVSPEDLPKAPAPGGGGKSATGAPARTQGAAAATQAAKTEAAAPNGAKPSGGALAQQRGAAAEDGFRQKLGATGSFKAGGREFDGAKGSRWLEFKSGDYWSHTQSSKGFAKFQSDMGARAKIAGDNGASLELHSNSPIPQHAKDWMDSKGIGYSEHPDLASPKE